MYYQLTCEIQESGIADIIKVDEGYSLIIEEWDLHLDLKRALQWHWFGSEINVGPALFSVHQIVENEKEINVASYFPRECYAVDATRQQNGYLARQRF